MKQLLSASLIVIFFVWILPLGAFIKPSKQKIACGGKRAIHQCLFSGGNQLKQNKSDDGPAVKLTNTSGQTNKPSSSSGGGNEYLISDRKQSVQEQAFRYQRSLFFLKQFLLISAIEHIPKP